MTGGAPRRMPLAPLVLTTGMQTLATMALFSVPAIAPAISAALDVSGALIGSFVAVAYGTGIISALLAPGLIHRYGGVRASQAVLISAAGMVMVAAAGNSVPALGLGAVVLGLGYGAAAPASTHLLAPQTPRHVFNMVMSVRQVGVPLGGALGSLILPPLAVALGWRAALLAEAVPALILAAAMERVRARWDTGRDEARPAFGRAALQPFRLLRDVRMRRLSVASFMYSGVQLCFIAFMTVQLTSVAGFGLIWAGRMLAMYQIAGTVTRPLWGWMADRFATPRHTLAVLGLGMALAAVAAGGFGTGWPRPLVVLVAAWAGATASGYTGVAYAEYARLGGARRTEATGLGTAMMFAGVMVIPPLFGVAVARSGGYLIAYLALAAGAAMSAALLALPAQATAD